MIAFIYDHGGLRRCITFGFTFAIANLLIDLLEVQTKFGVSFRNNPFISSLLPSFSEMFFGIFIACGIKQRKKVTKLSRFESNFLKKSKIYNEKSCIICLLYSINFLSLLLYFLLGGTTCALHFIRYKIREIGYSSAEPKNWYVSAFQERWNSIGNILQIFPLIWGIPPRLVFKKNYLVQMLYLFFLSVYSILLVFLTSVEQKLFYFTEKEKPLILLAYIGQFLIQALRIIWIKEATAYDSQELSKHHISSQFYVVLFFQGLFSFLFSLVTSLIVCSKDERRIFQFDSFGWGDVIFILLFFLVKVVENLSLYILILKYFLLNVQVYYNISGMLFFLITGVYSLVECKGETFFNTKLLIFFGSLICFVIAFLGLLCFLSTRYEVVSKSKKKRPFLLKGLYSSRTKKI